MPSWGDSSEVMLRLKLPRGNLNLAVMNNLDWSSGLVFSCWGFPWSLWVFSAYFPVSFCIFKRVLKVRKIFDVFEVSLAFFKSTEEKKDKGFPETESRTGTAGTVFQEPKLEPSFPARLYWNTENPFFFFRNPEKGALNFAKGALRKFVANCAPNLRKIAGISFCASEEGSAKLSQICREFEKSISDNFMQVPLFQCPFSKFLIFSAAAFWGFSRGGFPENACIGGAISERDFCEICRRKSTQNTQNTQNKALRRGSWTTPSQRPLFPNFWFLQRNRRNRKPEPLEPSHPNRNRT